MPMDGQPDTLRDQPAPYAPPPETQRLIDELYREELREARAMSAEEKVLAGQQLFESACEITLAGIHNQNSGFTQEQCRNELRRRLEWQRKVEAL